MAMMVMLVRAGDGDNDGYDAVVGDDDDADVHHQHHRHEPDRRCCHQFHHHTQNRKEERSGTLGQTAGSAQPWVW